MNPVLSLIHLIKSSTWTNAINLYILQMYLMRLRDFKRLTDSHINTEQGQTQTKEPWLQVLGSPHCLPATNPATEMNILLLINLLEYTPEQNSKIQASTNLSFYYFVSVLSVL